jgi:SAM-dependent methyltransferase
MEDLPEWLKTSDAVDIADRLGTISGGRILDVATANGDFIRLLMRTIKAYDSFVGVDTSKDDLKSARKRFKEEPVKLFEMNAEDLKFEDESFDTVSISYSLHHLENPNKVLTEMRRVLRSGGNFIVQEDFCDGEQTEPQRTSIARHHLEAEIDSLLGVTHHRTLTLQRIREIIDGLRLKEPEVFEPEYPLRCMVCDERFSCDPRKGEGGFTSSQFSKETDDALRRLNGRTDSDTITRLREEGERLKERMKKFGSAPPRSLFFIGRK